MSDGVIAEASALIREKHFVAAVEQLDAARRAVSVEAMSEGLPPETAQPLKPDGETSVSEEQQIDSNLGDEKHVRSTRKHTGPARYRLSRPFRAELSVGGWVQVTNRSEPAQLQVDNEDASWQVEYANCAGTASDGYTDLPR